jgi:hypothetical protein
VSDLGAHVIAPSVIAAPVLIPQPGGFEGIRAIQEVLLPNNQAASELEELKYRLAYGHPAA